MFKKSFAFGLLAAVIVAPGAAFADSQSQNNNQNTIQEGTAIGGSTNAQSSESLNIQEQIQNRRDSIGRSRGGYGRRFPRPSFCGGSYNGQSQNSSQGTVQSGAAVDYSDNAQSNSNVNDQKQVANNSRVCR
jgi:opacity protein-like surface antigen